MRLGRRTGWFALWLGLLGAGGPPGKTQARAAASPVFEVSTVKINRSGSSASQSHFTQGLFVASNVKLKNVMEYSAYGLPEARIVGGPKWLDSERFDIEAKMDGAAAEQLQKLSREQRRAQMQAMFQQLLAERFKLAVHWETQEMPVYALVIAKKGPLLTKAAKPDGATGTSASRDQLTAKNVTMNDLVRTMTQEFSGELGRVVVDRTGIQGKYDVSLKWSPEMASGDADNGTALDKGPSLFTAIQEQLGLKLESSKGPVEVLVIDHIEEPLGN